MTTNETEIERLRRLIKELEANPLHKSISLYWRLLDNLYRLEQQERNENNKDN